MLYEVSTGGAALTRSRDRWRRTVLGTGVPGEPVNRGGLAVVAGLMFVFFSLRYGERWLSEGNITNMAIASAATLIAAMGTMALLVSGNVDVSIGGIYAVTSVVCAEVAVASQNAVLAVLAGLGAGFVLGAANGWLVRLLSLNPIIVTLGAMSLYKGVAFMISGGVSVFGFPVSFSNIGRGGVGDVTYPIIVAGVVFAAVAFWLVRSVSGLHVYAIGGNRRAAELSGIRVNRTVWALFALNGALVGLVGVLTTARVGVGDPGLGTGFEFDVLTAAILGGVAWNGGGGRPVGVLIGVATIAILNTGLIFEGLADYYQQIAKGGLLVVALAADQLAHARRRARAAPTATAGLDADVGGAAPALSVDRGQRRPAGSHDADRAEAVLTAQGLSKQYGPVTALSDAGFGVHRGEIVCLVGDNGAGKSTLVKLLSGAEQPDAGEIRVGGVPVRFDGPGAAQDAGIHTVYQDLALCPTLSVTHNFVLGREPRRRLLGVVPVRDDVAAERAAQERLRALGVNLVRSDTLVRDLSGGQRQSVAVARAVDASVRVAIFDEPTAALGVKQTDRVLALVRSVAAGGTGVILISHNVETVLAVADRVVVLRLGRVIYDGSAERLSELDLLQMMAGIGLAPTTAP